MNGKRQLKLVQAGEYVAQVEVELVETSEGWSPYLSLADAQKLDAAREALSRGDLQAASRLGLVYKLVPVTG